GMPDLDGAAATAEITKVAPHVGVLILTWHQDDESLFQAMRAGARGYLLKGAGQDEITRAITAVAAGEAIFAPAVAQRVLTYLTHPHPATDQAFPELTTREREVLNLLATGLSNPEIATRLSVSTKTVGNYTSTIFAKLQVATRSEAIIRARDAGLGR